MAIDTRYQRLDPSPELRDIVESIWMQHDAAPGRPRRTSCVIPTGTVELLFQYGEPVAHISGAVRQTMPVSYATGQRSRPVEVIATGALGIVIVSLYPWGLGALFPAAGDTRDGYVDLRLLDKTSRIARLEALLRAATSGARRVQLVESYLLARRRACADRRIAEACRILARPGLRAPVREAARALQVSERHLNRWFGACVGLPPGVFARIMRFQGAIRMRRRTRQPWAAIAAGCGYSDQAHLIREFQRFSGRPPGRIVFDAHAGNSTFNGDGGSAFFDTVYL